MFIEDTFKIHPSLPTALNFKFPLNTFDSVKLSSLSEVNELFMSAHSASQNISTLKDLNTFLFKIVLQEGTFYI